MKKVLILFIMTFLLFNMTGCENDKKDLTDAVKFKNEYENLNGDHRTITIEDDNPFVYITPADLIKKIEDEETFYVYFGSAYCPWCRSVIEKAIEVANKNGINKIYYIDIWEGDHKEILRDSYKLNESGQAELVSEGTEEYKKILDYFDSVLGDYKLTDKDDNIVLVGEKRITAPNFIYVENGDAVTLVSGVSSNQKDYDAKLTDEILNDEEQIFDEFFVSDICTEDSSC